MKAYPYDIKEKWPFHYVISALYFFALDSKFLTLYLPGSFPETTFHGGLGDFISKSSLHSTILIYAECINAGRTWNDWIENEIYQDDNLPKMFDLLHKQIDKILDEDTERENKALDILIKSEKHPLTQAFVNARQTAREILKEIGWYEDNKMPPISCRNILNEYSYGAYDRTRLNGKERAIRYKPPWEL